MCFYVGIDLDARFVYISSWVVHVSVFGRLCQVMCVCVEIARFVLSLEGGDLDVRTCI